MLFPSISSMADWIVLLAYFRISRDHSSSKAIICSWVIFGEESLLSNVILIAVSVSFFFSNIFLRPIAMLTRLRFANWGLSSLLEILIIEGPGLGSRLEMLICEAHHCSRAGSSAIMSTLWTVVHFLVSRTRATWWNVWILLESVIQCTLYSCSLYTGCIYRGFPRWNSKSSRQSSTQSVTDLMLSVVLRARPPRILPSLYEHVDINPWP